ncbi:GDSL-type esterase/lipase family protein [Sphingomonas xanthus]|uniref:SGNH hydrolase-type esterase domain-containing protein n=1 Tax=Sphingomonas xanthus TaxID=2594473 RepID=A0A516IR27_9SPHN|nr:GDSL-type esterase/lipase family protein [Sphingomonas xanthus]QDP19357.1 hypothetical protein FMM02_04875 [Sphingomonas xanthus]
MTAVRAAFFGDSLTLGVGDPEKLGWAGRLARAAQANGHDITAYNLGIRRDTSSDIARRWGAEAEARLPASARRLLLFSFGTNDCLEEDGRRRVSHAQSLDNARAILEPALRFAPVLVVGPPPVADEAENLRIAALSSDQHALCDRLGIDFIPLFALLRCAEPWVSSLSDGYHPGAAGYALAADIIGASPKWTSAIGGEDAPPVGLTASG